MSLGPLPHSVPEYDDAFGNHFLEVHQEYVQAHLTLIVTLRMENAAAYDEKNAAWTAVYSRRTLNRSRPPLALCREYPSQGSRSGRRRETGTAMAFHLCTIQASIVVCDVLGRMSCRSVRG